MIEDLEGATSEPSRRRHVAARSAATAAVALVLLFALVTPRTSVDTPLAASPAPIPTDGRVVIFPEVRADPRSSGEVIFRVPADARSSDYMTSTVCVTAVAPNPTIHLIVFDRTGQPIAAYTGGTTGRFIALPQAYVGSGWRPVPCDTSDVFAPRINRAR